MQQQEDPEEAAAHGQASLARGLGERQPRASSRRGSSLMMRRRSASASDVHCADLAERAAAAEAQLRSRVDGADLGAGRD